MARPEVRERQYTIYLPSKEDIKRWRKLSKPLTLNKWIFEMVERSIENKPSRTKDTEELNALRKENLELKKDLEISKAKLQQTENREKEYALERTKKPLLDKQIIDILKTSDNWSYGQIRSVIISAEMKRTHSDGVNISEIDKRVRRTIEELEYAGLMIRTARGLKWIK